MEAVRFYSVGTPQMTAIRKKLVIVGDGEGSERRPLSVFGDGQLADAPVPAVLENYVATIDVRAELALWDTAGQEDYDRLRPLSHLKRGSTLMCFSIDSPDFLHKPESWRPEVRHFCASVSVIFAKVMNPGYHLPMLADPAMTKHEHGVPEEKCTTSVKTNADDSPGVQSAKTKDGVREVVDSAKTVSYPRCRGRRIFNLFRNIE
ncbi:ras-like GTP-binding protein rhoA [Rhipicephalus sanguineus]|uniref:Uncharacterized protein n=1 Tax=Rhipicephalus sanguineus TaxID=34632 RepID=A0A9D4TB54_RHISA|nr:ras-like GTP-binding protein rhoA [Rhipicephalus sanguineus]KAH7984196.1 hypothetical protein HPB52_017906 [Rhipicephalus sanguineus]